MQEIQLTQGQTLTQSIVKKNNQKTKLSPEKGCALGTKCAPSYANAFMGWFEETFIFPLLTNVSNFYLRFIDDVFLIWNGIKTEFDSFLKKINECHPSIKF